MHIIIKIPKQICLKPYYVSVGRCWGEGGGGWLGTSSVAMPRRRGEWGGEGGGGVRTGGT